MRYLKQMASATELRSLSVIAVIINCGTHWLTSLALVSTLKAVDFPVLLVNCGDTSAAYRHFSRLGAEWQLDFFYCDMPLRKHGETLDRIFSELTVDFVLLVDSDVEVLDRTVVARMLDCLRRSHKLYGCGLLHGPEAMDERHGFRANVMFYQQRMWIPFVLLRVSAIGEALRNQQSFLQFRTYSELPGWPTLSKVLAVRFWLPLRKLLGLAVRPYCSSMSAPIAEYDTGAAVHEYLTQRGREFRTFPELECSVVHLHGATRAKNRPFWKQALRWFGLSIQDNAIAATDVGDLLIQQRLDKYKLSVAEGDKSGVTSPTA
jgi:hypothetical protein